MLFSPYPQKGATMTENFTDNASSNRFELDVGGTIAFVNYPVKHIN
jgi:hypothetical protein